MICTYLQDSGVDRQDIFIATKMWPDDYGSATALQACQTALNKLGTEYLGINICVIFISRIRRYN